MSAICGAETATGRFCRRRAGACTLHGEAPPAADASRPAAVPASRQKPGKRDLRAVGWRLVDGLMEGEVEPRRASAITAALRVLAGLDPDELEEEEYLRRVELNGVLMHGEPPRDEEEWELARQLFEPDAIRMMEGWERESRARHRARPSWYEPLEPSYRVGEP